MNENKCIIKKCNEMIEAMPKKIQDRFLDALNNPPVISEGVTQLESETKRKERVFESLLDAVLGVGKYSSDREKAIVRELWRDRYRG